MSEFQIFTNKGQHKIKTWPEAPPWRKFEGVAIPRALQPEPNGRTFKLVDDKGKDTEGQKIIDLVNAAIHLRRPLLVTGKPGTGKSSLAEAIAHELDLGELLIWPINSRSTLQEGLYRYDALARLQDTSAQRVPGTGGQHDAEDIGSYIRLAALGTALLPAERPRVLLIDEIDKSDIDLPNDLLHVFEKGRYEIPELVRHAKRKREMRARDSTAVAVATEPGAPGAELEPVMVRPDDGEDEVPIVGGKVVCKQFPIVVLTSNGEREFPPAFRRRCLHVSMPEPSDTRLVEIVTAHLGADAMTKAEPLIKAFLAKRKDGYLATDQLLNAVRLAMNGAELGEGSTLREALFRPLTGAT